MDRRTFHRLCGGLIGGAAALHRELATAAAGEENDETAFSVAADTGAPWPRTRLLGADEEPLTPDTLAPGESLVFHYPYRVTPCFLLKLDPGDADLARSSGGAWPGAFIGASPTRPGSGILFDLP